MKLTPLEQRQMQNERLKEMTSNLDKKVLKNTEYTNEQLQGWISRNNWQGSDASAMTAIGDAQSIHLS